MQGVISTIEQLFAGLLLVVHALVVVFTPHPYTSLVPLPVEVGVSATSSAPVGTTLFPTAKNKTATASTTSSLRLVTPKNVAKPQQNPVAKAKPESEGSAQAPSIPTSLPPPLSAQAGLPQSVVNDEARAALVNVLCITKSGGYLNPISGSGVMVAGSGIVMTNAHVGQYFLLRDYPIPGNVTCVIRTGSPATPKYKAELLYLPPAWIAANASQITVDEGMGTGEHDYAFLRITGTTDPNGTLPKTFPYLAMTTDYPERDEPVLLAAYPAGFIEGITIEMNLYITSAISSIGELYAFDTEGGTPDVVSVGSTVVSQAGASGGAVVRMQDGALQAIVATATVGDTTSSRVLNGITLSHIDRSLKAAGQGGLATLLTGDLAQKAADFAKDIAPGEKQKLINAFKK